MIATLQENYVLTARSKGLPDKYIPFRTRCVSELAHLMTIVGINLPRPARRHRHHRDDVRRARPGLPLINASTRDILVIQGITVFIATAYVVINTVVDLLYSALDPRIRRS
ncbi:MAG: hypothetical protein R2713_20900 [Ilumatobacteraceae bacterium]